MLRASKNCLGITVLLLRKQRNFSNRRGNTQCTIVDASWKGKGGELTALDEGFRVILFVVSFQEVTKMLSKTVL